MAATEAAAMGQASSLTEHSVSGQVPWVFRERVSRPVQQRSEQSFLRFLDAAETLLEEYSWTALTVQQVVEAAEASVGSFYNRFEDKLALLNCLEDRLTADFKISIQALMDECDRCKELLADVDGIIVSLFLRLCSQRKGVIRALDLVQRLDPPGEGQQGFSGAGQMFEGVLKRFAAYLADKPDYFDAAPSADIHRALRETFWLTRENLLYGENAEKLQSLHASLRQHFFASLRFPV